MKRNLSIYMVVFFTLVSMPIAAADLEGIWTGIGSLTKKDRLILTLKATKDNYVGTITNESGTLEKCALPEIFFAKNMLLFVLQIADERLVRVALHSEGEKLTGMSSVASGQWKPMELTRTSHKIPVHDFDAVLTCNKKFEPSYLKFPLQKLVIEDFKAKGYILDIGGGGEGVIGQMKPKQAIAIDLFEDELADAPKGPLKIVMDATELKFLDQAFSAATSFFTLMYMNEYSQEQSFREIHRVLVPKGRFLVWDVFIPAKKDNGHNVAVFPFTFVLPNKKVINTGYGVRWPKNAHDLQYYRALAKKTGFRVIREKRWSQAFFLELESEPNRSH